MIGKKVRLSVMNMLKKEYIDLINKLPDDVGTDEIVDHVNTKARIEASRKNIRETGGISFEDFKRRQDARRKALFEGKG